MEIMKLVMRAICFVCGLFLVLQTKVHVNPDGVKTPVSDIVVIIATYLFELALVFVPIFL